MYTDHDRYRDVCVEFEHGGYITGLSRVIKRGKEATVLCCEAHPTLGVSDVALKIYTDRAGRNFRNDATYLSGRVWKRRDVAHLHAMKDDIWVATEFAALQTLWAAGVRVPRPYTHSKNAILMERVCRGGDDAPQLKDVRLSSKEAERALDALLDALDAMLYNQIVHGDLSAFNILYDGAAPVIIDFPQVVDPTTNANAWVLFHRDVENLLRYFAHYGLPESRAPSEIAEEIWTRYFRSEPRPVLA